MIDMNMNEWFRELPGIRATEPEHPVRREVESYLSTHRRT